MWICIVPCREHTSKVLRCGTHSQRISQFYLHTLHLSANGMNHSCLCLQVPSRSWYSFTDPREMEGWVGLGRDETETFQNSILRPCQYRDFETENACGIPCGPTGENFLLYWKGAVKSSQMMWKIIINLISGSCDCMIKDDTVDVMLMLLHYS